MAGHLATAARKGADGIADLGARGGANDGGDGIVVLTAWQRRGHRLERHGGLGSSLPVLLFLLFSGFSPVFLFPSQPFLLIAAPSMEEDMATWSVYCAREREARWL